MKKRVISAICIISCGFMVAGVSVQAGEKESGPTAIANEREEEIFFDDYDSTSMTDSRVHFDNCPFEYIEYME